MYGEPAMPTVKDFGRFKIRIYFDDHGEPHFHIIAADFAAKVSIETLELIAGDAPSRVLKQARDWADANRTQLRDVWNRGNG